MVDTYVDSALLKAVFT